MEEMSRFIISTMNGIDQNHPMESGEYEYSYDSIIYWESISRYILAGR